MFSSSLAAGTGTEVPTDKPELPDMSEIGTAYVRSCHAKECSPDSCRLIFPGPDTRRHHIRVRRFRMDGSSSRAGNETGGARLPAWFRQPGIPYTGLSRINPATHAGIMRETTATTPSILGVNLSTYAARLLIEGHGHARWLRHRPRIELPASSQVRFTTLKSRSWEHWHVRRSCQLRPSGKLA